MQNFTFLLHAMYVCYIRMNGMLNSTLVIYLVTRHIFEYLINVFYLIINIANSNLHNFCCFSCDVGYV